MVCMRPTPLVASVSGLCEDSLVEPHDLLVAVNRQPHAPFHLVEEMIIAPIVCLGWHLLDSDDLEFDAILSVHFSKPPPLDKLVWEGTVEENYALC